MTERKHDDDRPLPTGLLMALGQNMRAMERFSRLSPAAREEVVDRAAHTHSREEMRTLVAGIGMEDQAGSTPRM